MGGDEIGQARLIDGQLTLIECGDLTLVLVDADHVVPKIVRQ
jgi:hypothetical protein